MGFFFKDTDEDEACCPECPDCGEHVDLAERHVTFVRQVESEHGGVVTVHDSVVTEWHHLACMTVEAPWWLRRRRLPWWSR